MQSEDEEVPDDEEQENIKKMKEKVQHTCENKEKIEKLRDAYKKVCILITNRQCSCI